MDYLKHGIETLQAGSTGTLNCLEIARKYNAKFLLASTSECYGDPLEHPQKESYWGHVNPIGPRSVYDEAKRFAEAATMAYHRYHHVDTRIVRIFNTYGPRLQINDGRVISNFMKQALRGEDAHRLWRRVADPQLLLRQRRGRGNSRAVESARITGHEHRQSRASSRFSNVLKRCWRLPARTARFGLSRCRRTIRSSAALTSRRRKHLLGWEPKIDLLSGLRLSLDYFKTALRAQPEPAHK